jgi:hypothetical protein
VVQLQHQITALEVLGVIQQLLLLQHTTVKLFLPLMVVLEVSGMLVVQHILAAGAAA